MHTIDVAIAIVYHNMQVLICRRRPEGHLGGFWEFPGGKIEVGETPNHCAERELREEVGIICEATVPIRVIEHAYPDRSVRIHPFLCAFRSGTAAPLGCDEAIWINPARLRDYTFPPANDQLIEQIIQLLTSR